MGLIKITCAQFIVRCTYSRQPEPDAAKQAQNITEPPPCFTLGTVFFLCCIFGSELFFCVRCVKAPVLSRLPKGHSPRNFGANPSLAFTAIK